MALPSYRSSGGAVCQLPHKSYETTTYRLESMLKGNTIGEIYGPAMEVTTQAEADEYFKEIVDHAVSKHGKSIKETERVVRANLGYYAGYYSDETRERVERLFKCCHPVFGTIASNGAPTVEQALNEGVKIGKALL